MTRKRRTTGDVKSKMEALRYLSEGLKNGDPREAAGLIRKAMKANPGEVADALPTMFKSYKKVMNELLPDLQRKVLGYQRRFDIDGTTGLKRKEVFEGELKEEFLKRERGKGKDDPREPISLIISDIDKFKRFNTYLDPAIGDQALWHVSQYLLSVIAGKGRGYKYYGGDEQTAVLPRLTLRAASTMARKFHKLVNENPYVLDTECPENGKVPDAYREAHEEGIILLDENLGIVSPVKVTVGVACLDGKNPVRETREAYTDAAALRSFLTNRRGRYKGIREALRGPLRDADNGESDPRRMVKVYREIERIDDFLGFDADYKGSYLFQLANRKIQDKDKLVGDGGENGRNGVHIHNQNP